MRKKFRISDNEAWAKMNVQDKLGMIIKWVENQKDKKSVDYHYIVKLLRTDNYNDFNRFPTVNTYFDLLDLKNIVDKAYNNEVPLIKRNCKDCGKEFVIYISERDDYFDKGLHLPKRCKSCRQANKQKKIS